MKISNGLKQVIFKKLYEDLSHVEIIPYGKSIWFIDRKNEYWYFEYEKSGRLWWRYGFFQNFFDLFSLESDEFQPIISEWVEEVLNCKVHTTARNFWISAIAVEEVLNCKVHTTHRVNGACTQWVEEILNCKIHTTASNRICLNQKVEEVLNYKVRTTQNTVSLEEKMVEEVLNCKVTTHGFWEHHSSTWVEEVLKYKVESTSFTTRTRTIAVGQVLNYKVITPRRWDSTFQYSVEEVLNNNEDILETLPDSSKGKEEPNCGVETIRSSYFPCQKLMKRILKFINKH